jgi:hypothetical protein
MAYVITTTQGAPIATVQDATINTAALGITLIGRDYAGYGAFLNENFVYLLENFASPSDSTGTPTNPKLYDSTNSRTLALTGQLWYDTNTNTLKVWNSSINRWKPISSSIASVSPPTAVTSVVGDFWWDTANSQLYVYSGPTNGWILIGPPDSSTGSGAIVATISAAGGGGDKIVVELKVNGTIVAIISDNAAFTPATSIAGFTTINPGINLINSSALSGSQYTGSASNALTLNGVSSNQFLRSDQNTTTAYSITAGGGFVVASDLSITLDTADNRVAVNTIQNNRDLNFYVNQNGSNIAAIAISAQTGTVTINDDAVVTGSTTVKGAFTANTTTTLVGQTTLRDRMVPVSPNSIDIGATGTRFNNLYATTLYGNLVGGLTSVSTFTVAGAATLSSTLTVGDTSTFTGAIIANGVTTVNGNIIVANTYVPASNTAIGTKGQISWNSGFLYVCIAANTWARTSLTTSW